MLHVFLGMHVREGKMGEERGDTSASVCDVTYQGLPMLGLHCLGYLSHLDGGSGRAAEMKTPPPLPEADCPGRQLGGAQECLH